MKRLTRWILVMVTGAVFIMTCFFTASLSITSLAANGTPIPTAWIYLPCIGKPGYPTATPTLTATLTPTPSNTLTPSATLTLAATDTPTATSTPSLTATNTPTPTDTATPTSTYIPTSTPSRAASPTNSPTLTSTSTPQPTSTPTKTSSPTNTPTPTQTTLPPGVYILPNHSYYVDSINYLHVVGEVQNSTPNHLRFVQITANFFNSGGQLLDTRFTFTYLDNLPPSTKTCFHILLPKPDNWSYYEFEAPSYWTDGEPLPNLAVFNHTGSYDRAFHWYTIIGQVRNDHGTRVEYVSPVGTVYNASSTVVGCDFCFVNSTHLDPGQTSSFKMILTGRDYADVVSYRLQVDGRPQ